MSPVSGIASGSAIYRPATANVAKPKPAPPTPTQSKGSDPDHDGDSNAGGLDVMG